MIRWENETIRVTDLNDEHIGEIRWAVIPRNIAMNGSGSTAQPRLVIAAIPGHSSMYGEPEFSATNREWSEGAVDNRYISIHNRVDFFGWDFAEWGYFRSGLGRMMFQDAESGAWDSYVRYHAFSASAVNRMLHDIFDKARELWPPCEECGSTTGDEHQHVECAHCHGSIRSGNEGIANFLDPVTQEQTTVLFHNRSHAQVVEGCGWSAYAEAAGREGTAIVSCRQCGVYTWGDSMVEAHYNGYTQQWCSACANQYLFECAGCGEQHGRRGLDYPYGRVRIRTTRPARAQEHEGEQYCQPCYNRAAGIGTIYGWNHKPALVFNPDIPEDVQQPLYIGMELETSFPNGVSPRSEEVLKWIGKLPEGLVFVKTDGSVNNGLEIVTHPFQPKWGMENFPFEMFDELTTTLGAYKTHSSCGTHIHMNKESFSTAHLWKFLQLHYRLRQFCQMVGGRRSNSYANFGDLDRQRPNAMDIMKKKKSAIHDYARMSAVNLRNEYTIELRYMAGGSDPHNIKKNLQWALALYEYANHIGVGDVKDGALNDAGYLLEWIREGDYPDLQAWVQTNDTGVKPKQLKERA